MTSGCMSPRSLFPTGQRFPLPNHVTSGCLSPRSIFSTGQRFPLPNHGTSGEPAIPFFPWSAVSHPTSGHDVTRPIRSQHWDNLRSGFLFFRGGGRAKKKESLIQLLVESSAAPQLKCLSTRVSAMPSDKSEPITIYRKSLRWRESAEARSGHVVCKQLYVAFCFPTN